MIYLLSKNSENDSLKSFLKNHPFITNITYELDDNYKEIFYKSGEKNYFIVVYDSSNKNLILELLNSSKKNQVGILITEKNKLDELKDFNKLSDIFIFHHEEEELYKQNFVNIFLVYNEEMKELYEKHNENIDELYGEEKIKQKEKIFMKKPQNKIKSRFSKPEQQHVEIDKDLHKKDICCFKGDKINYQKLFNFNLDFHLKIEFFHPVDVYYKIIYYKILLIYSKQIDEVNCEILQKCIDNNIIIVCVSGKKNISEHYLNNIIFLDDDDKLPIKLNKIISEYGNINMEEFISSEDFTTEEQCNQVENIKSIEEQNTILAEKVKSIFPIKDKKYIDRERSSIDLYHYIEEKIYGPSYKHDFGFVIIRYVDCERINQYWNESVRCIKKNYPDKKIVIIDDNSNKYYLNKEEDINLNGVDIFYSEYPKKGETLGYYYMYKYRLFEKGVIIHDSVFILEPFLENIDFNHIDIKFLWHFTHHWDNVLEEEKMIVNGGLERLLEKFKDKDSWVGCFGVMSIIEFDFLNNIEVKYNFFKRVFPNIHNRDDRCHIERIFAFLCFLEKPSLIESPSLFGTIHHFVHWGYLYEYYLDYKQKVESGESELIYPILKVWSGR